MPPVTYLGFTVIHCLEHQAVAAPVAEPASVMMMFCYVCRQLGLSVQLQKNVSQRTQLQLMCYQWLYEDVLTNAGHQQPHSGPRASLMTDLKKVLLQCSFDTDHPAVGVQNPMKMLNIGF